MLHHQGSLSVLDFDRLSDKGIVEYGTINGESQLKYLANWLSQIEGMMPNIVDFSYAEVIDRIIDKGIVIWCDKENDKYYEGIRNTPGAVFVKLCDRIANVQYSKMTKSRMFEMYKKENDEFIVKLGYDDTNTHPYFEMFSYLVNLFND